MLYFRAFVTVGIISFLSGCSSGWRPEPTDTGWPGANYATVAVYRFSQPWEAPGAQGRQSVISMVSHGRVDFALLKKHLVGAGVLNADQTKRLINSCYYHALFDRGGISLCAGYNPHHLFVFYSKDGLPVAYAEYCQQCDEGESSVKSGTHFDTNGDAMDALLTELHLSGFPTR